MHSHYSWSRKFPVSNLSYRPDVDQTIATEHLLHLTELTQGNGTNRDWNSLSLQAINHHLSHDPGNPASAQLRGYDLVISYEEDIAHGPLDYMVITIHH